MPRYRKKPVVIEAFQFTKERRWDNSEWPEWLNEAWNTEKHEPGAFFCNSRPPHAEVYIHTLEGNHEVTPGDFIIQGVQGELYPCKPDIFEATYDLVAD